MGVEDGAVLPGFLLLICGVGVGVGKTACVTGGG